MESQPGGTQADIVNVMKDSGPASTGLTFIWYTAFHVRDTFLVFYGSQSAWKSRAELELFSKLLRRKGIKILAVLLVHAIFIMIPLKSFKTSLLRFRGFF